MKKLLYIILLLPLWVNAQNVSMNKTGGQLRTMLSGTARDTVPMVTGALVDGYILKYHAATNKWYASPDPTYPGLQDSLNTRVKKTGDTMTGTLNGTDIVLSGDLEADSIRVDAVNATGVIASNAIMGALVISGGVTNERYIDISNVGGSGKFGVESNAGGEIITGSTGYDMAMTGSSGISFSGNGGTTLHARLSNLGTMLLGGAAATNPLSIRTANGESYIRFLNSDGSSYGDFERSVTGTGAVRFTGAYFRTVGVLQADGGISMATTPTTSAGSYDVLTRNSSTGVVEKVAMASGTYTPTLTNGTNVASSTSQKAFYQRVGNIVTVSGSMVVTPTSTGNTRIDIALPIASALVSNADLAGQSTGLSGVATDGLVYADGTNDRAQCLYIVNSASAQLIIYSFSYEIL